MRPVGLRVTGLLKSSRGGRQTLRDERGRVYDGWKGQDISRVFEVNGRVYFKENNSGGKTSSFKQVYTKLVKGSIMIVSSRPTHKNE